MSNNPQRNWPARKAGGLTSCGKKIAGPDNWSGDQLRKKGNGQDEIAQRFGRLQDAAINVERVRERMERVKGDADRQKNVEMRWLIDDADAREQPLEIFEQKVPVFEKPQHAQVHADARHQPGASGTMSLGLGHSSAEPKIHCRCGKEQRGKWRVPRAVKNVACGHEEILPRVPGTHAPIGGDDDYKKDDEGERIEKHDRRATAYLRRMLMASTFCRGIQIDGRSAGTLTTGSVTESTLKRDIRATASRQGFACFAFRLATRNKQAAEGYIFLTVPFFNRKSMHTISMTTRELPLISEQRRLHSPAITPQALTWDDNAQLLWMGRAIASDLCD